MNRDKLKIRIFHEEEGSIRQQLQVDAAELSLEDNAEFVNPIQLDLSIEKVGRTITINADIATRCLMECDRCLEPFDYSLRDNVKVVLSTDQQFRDEEDDDISYISESENEVDLTEPIRETLLLSLPQKRLCEQACKGLCPQCGKNLNVESCQCKVDKTDPRWDKLKILLNKNNDK